ncbi:DUF4160 domain-containing protein [Duganella sp. SG902]|uniref:DUF4160 domain-containing protein n=1 Tax=Duganella sp. SG902 TaxID=2587016 RepID=UPI0035A72EFB
MARSRHDTGSRQALPDFHPRFYPREETRIHVHVSHPDGEAKFWLSPEVSLAENRGLSSRQLRTVEHFVKNNQSELKDAWRSYFSSSKNP